VSAPPRVRVKTIMGEVQRDDALYADGRNTVVKVETDWESGRTTLHYGRGTAPRPASLPQPSDNPVTVWRRPLRRGDLVIVGKRGRNVSMVSRLEPSVDLVPPRFEPWLTGILAECGTDHWGHPYAPSTRTSESVRGNLVRVMTYELAPAWAAVRYLQRLEAQGRFRSDDDIRRAQHHVRLAVARADDDPAMLERVIGALDDQRGRAR
jgi:hypothetical protein